MGAVWLAEDTRLRRQVALKMVRSADTIDAASRERLMREARAAAALNHPHIATVHDVCEQDGQVVIVFEYVEGETLHAVLRRGPLPAAGAVDIAMQIARALSAAHAQGIVHRDLKPANVIVGAGGHVKVLDFGIARVLAVGTTETAGAAAQSSGAGFIGTPGYAAPEQMVSTAVDERADLYALGVMLFEMIGGRRPFPGHDPLALATSKLSQDAPPLSSTGQTVPPALERFVAALLARDRADRPGSAAEALAALRAIYGTPSTATLAAARSGKLWSSVAAVVAIIALAGFGAWELNRFVRPPIDPSAPPVIAVLPLTNDSGDPSRDHVAAGIAESLISSLASLPSVTVLSRASVTEARTRAKDEAALAKDLGATYVVNGSVQEANGMLKISLNLVNPDRTVAWGESVEGTFNQIFALQSRLATALTNALVVRVSASERERMNAQPTTSPEALSAYWQGKALLERSDVKGNTEAAIGDFDRAIRLDPRFALAHSGLSQSYRRKYSETRDPKWAEQAIDAANTALRLDPDKAEVRFVLALTLEGGGRLAEAAEELSRALAIQPNFEEARRQLGQVLASQGNIEGAVTEFRKAIALRPNAAGGYSQMGLALLRAARYQEAVAAFEEAVRIARDNFTYRQQLGTAYQFLGDNDRALENYREAIAIRPSAPAYSNIGALLHQRGDFTGAVEAYRQAIAIRPNSAVTHRNLGDALTRLGRKDDARASYEEALRLFEIDLGVNPKDARAMALSAVVAHKAGQSALARKRLTAALRLAPTHPEVLYRAASLWALSGDTTTALDYLGQAIGGGYSKVQALEDDDLASLRNSEHFHSLMRSDEKEKPE
jgi:eukaryotic-like serine/threonine-protein kinase